MNPFLKDFADKWFEAVGNEGYSTESWYVENWGAWWISFSATNRRRSNAAALPAGMDPKQAIREINTEINRLRTL